MKANWVQSKLLLHLGPKSHTGENLRLVKNLQRFGATTLDGMSAYITKGTTPTTFGFEYLASGIRFIRSKNIGEISVGGDFEFISSACDEALKRSRIRRDDVLLNIVGASIGRAAVYLSDEPANTNQAVAIIRLPKSKDSAFLAAWLNSNVCQRLIYAEQSGLARDNFDLYQIGELLIPTLSNGTKSYVGDKVRQSERLRSHTRAVQSEAQSFFSLPGMDAVRIGEFKAYRTNSGTADSVRLDPKFYDPGHFKLRELLLPHQPIAISELCSPVSLRWAREEPEFFYLEIGELDIGSGLIKPARLATVDAPSRATTLVQPGDILVSTVRPNRKNVGLVTEIDEPLPIVASSGFSVLRFRSSEEAAFYLFWLRSDAATMQLMRWDAGSSYPAIDESVALKVLVPRYADEVVREKGARWDQSFRAQVLAEKLTTAAKLLVEALIEGKVPEAELITAQESLECGDATADRALLRRLTSQGIDTPGQPPLFPDLDALYALLAQTQEKSA